MKRSYSVTVGIATCMPLTFLWITASAALPAEKAPACSSLAASAQTLDAELASRTPKLYGPRLKSEFEKKADYERRIAQEVEKHNRDASLELEKVGSYKMTLPVFTIYDAEKERLRFNAPSISSTPAEVGLRKVTFATISTDASSDTREGRVGNAAIGINTTAFRHQFYGMAFPTLPNSPLLKQGAKPSLKIPPADAKRLSNQLAVVVVGRPAPPYGLATRSSGDAMYANGRMFQETYSTDYAVVSFVCAYLVDRSTNSAIELR